MNLTDRIKAFVELGKFLIQFADETPNKGNHSLNDIYFEEFTNLLARVSTENLWFTPKHVKASVKGICSFLNEESIEKWLKNYSIEKEQTNKTVAVIMAGNIPMVGFHDMMCVLLSGHKFIGKLSSKDNQLLDFMAKLLVKINPDFDELIQFQSHRLGGDNNFQAIIATGSNNSARYFDAYFGKYPNIIRRNRNSVAVISGNESEAELEALGNDVFLYFGLGCRNVSKIYLPEGYDTTKLLDSWSNYAYISAHSKYANNFDYQRSLLLMNKIPHLDNGFVLLQENREIASPIGLVYYEYYSELESLKQDLQLVSDSIQCIVGADYIPFGKAQEPELWDYADNVDTMQFLTTL
jgi:hypothetical protein